MFEFKWGSKVHNDFVTFGGCSRSIIEAYEEIHYVARDFD